MSFEEWKQRAESRPQQSQTQAPPPPPTRPDEVRLPSSTQSQREAIDQLARNQLLIDARLKRQDSKVDKKFNKIKG